LQGSESENNYVEILQKARLAQESES
jgi:hypothetical protein